MTVESRDLPQSAQTDAAPLLARASVADVHAARRLDTAIDDFFLRDDGRLDDRTRAAMALRVQGAVVDVEQEIIAQASRTLGLALGNPEESVFPRLIESGLLRDPDLMGELIAQLRLDVLDEMLRANRHPAAAPLLLPRLVDCGDRVIAQAATAYLAADGRRAARSRPGEFPAQLHHRIIWWTAAALRERWSVATPGALDRALIDAAIRSLSAHDDSDRLAVAALRLAVAIGARSDELPDLLIEALEEGRSALFVALIAHSQGIDFIEARDLVLDPGGDRLWLALRTQGLERTTIARIALALAAADHRRDIEAFADELDAIAEIASDVARASLAPLALHRDFRIAVRALARSGRR